MNTAKKYRAIYDGESFIDGKDFDTFEEAKDFAFAVLEGWAESKYDSSAEDWNYFYDNACVWVEEYDEEEHEYVECWSPSDEEYESWGFTEREE